MTEAIGDIKPGSVVRLKSGGPKMTVTSIGEHWSSSGTAVYVTWFDTKNEPKQDVYPIYAVEVAIGH